MRTAIVMAVRYLWERKLRTTLTTLAVVFGVGVIFGGNLTMPGAIDAFRRATLATAEAADLSITSRTGSSFTPEAALQAVAAVKGVRAVTPVLRRQVQVPANAAGVAPEIELVGVDPATVGSVREYRMASGRFLQPGDSAVAVISAPGEEGPQVAIGDDWPLVTAAGVKRFTVVGVLADQGRLAAPRVIVTLADAQAAVGQPGRVDSLDIALAPGGDRAAIKQAVLAAAGEGFQADAVTSQIDATSSLQVGYAIFDLLGVLALFVGGFLIFNTFRTVILERRHDLAMLRALGAEQRQVVRMIMVESLIQGVVGTGLGLVAGYAMAAGTAALFRYFGERFMPGMTMTIGFYPSAMVLATAFGLLTTLVAGYLPARAAGRVSPLEGLRPVPAWDVRRAARWSLAAGAVVMALALVALVASAQTAALGALLFLVGMAVAAPGLVVPLARALSPLLVLWFAREGDVAQGNMVRQPGRAAITASTLMIGLAVLVMATATISSLKAYVVDLFTRNFSSDLVLMPQSLFLGSNLGASGDLAERLRALPEVQAVGSVRYAGTLVGGQNASLIGIDPATYPQVSALIFSEGQPDEAYRALREGRAAIANSIAAGTLKLKRGDEVTLQTPQGPRSYRLVAIGGDALNFKISTLFVSQANLAADFYRSDDLMLMLKLKPGADLAAAQKGVETIIADYPQFSLKVTADYRQTMLDVSLRAMNVFYVLALIILMPAALGLLNTLTINVLERTREIGVLRAVGANRSQIRRMVTAEALLLGLFGAATGVVAGVVMSYGFVTAMGSFAWRLPYAFPLAGVLAAAVAAVLVALVASILPARNAARLDIIRALQYE